jgi:hypothetical protein
MAKDRHRNLELPFSGKEKAAPVSARRKGKAARARRSRRQLLLFDYQTWLTLTAGLDQSGAGTEETGGDRR